MGKRSKKGWKIRDKCFTTFLGSSPLNLRTAIKWNVALAIFHTWWYICCIWKISKYHCLLCCKISTKNGFVWKFPQKCPLFESDQNNLLCWKIVSELCFVAQFPQNISLVEDFHKSYFVWKFVQKPVLVRKFSTKMAMCENFHRNLLSWQIFLKFALLECFHS